MQGIYDLISARIYDKQFKERAAKKKKKAPHDTESYKKRTGQGNIISEYLNELREHQRLAIHDLLASGPD